MTDLSDQYNTKLSPADEAAYQSWAAKNNRTSDTYDYDMRGAWKDGAGQADNGHFPDTYKKPNHPTFSDQSQYSGKDGNVGGTWSKNGDQDVFTPSATNLQHTDPADLQNYFKKVEPDSKLNLPDSVVEQGAAQKEMAK